MRPVCFWRNIPQQSWAGLMPPHLCSGRFSKCGSGCKQWQINVPTRQRKTGKSTLSFIQQTVAEPLPCEQNREQCRNHVCALGAASQGRGTQVTTQVTTRDIPGNSWAEGRAELHTLWASKKPQSGQWERWDRNGQSKSTWERWNGIGWKWAASATSLENRKKRHGVAELEKMNLLKDTKDLDEWREYTCA